MQYLVTNGDVGLATLIGVEDALGVSTLAVGAPVGLLGVVGLEHVSALHLKGDHQEGAGIRVRLTGLSKLDVARHVVMGFWSAENRIDFE